MLLSVESLVSLLKVLGQDQALRQGGTQVGLEVKQALELYSKRFPEMGGGMPAAASAAAATAGGGGTGGGSEAIEELANAYFQKIYTSEQSIAEVIEMLKRFKNSKDAKEQEIFACMIRNLFDEYRFFHKYPEKVSPPSRPPSLPPPLPPLSHFVTISKLVRAYLHVLNTLSFLFYPPLSPLTLRSVPRFLRPSLPFSGTSHHGNPLRLSDSASARHFPHSRCCPALRP